MTAPVHSRSERTPVVQVENFAPVARASSRVILSRARLGFILLVMLPTVLTALYLSIVAAPRFQSSAQFVVRSQESASLGGLSSLVQSVATSTSYENAYAVIAWIRSGSALDVLIREVDYVAMVSDPAIDPLSRWTGPLTLPGREWLLDYYNSLVEVTIDTRSGIVKLEVTAFTPEGAQSIADALIVGAEALVNHMNAREYAARLAEAEGEVRRAEENLLAVHLDVQRNRIETGMVDPSLEAETGTGTLFALQQALVTQRAEYNALLAGNPDSPLLPQMRRGVQAMQEEIDGTRAALAGQSDSLVEKMTVFEQLNLSKAFATEALLSARRTLEAARMDASRKSLFLAAVTHPERPETPIRLRALLATLTVFAGLFLVYAILWLLLVNIREHRAD